MDVRKLRYSLAVAREGSFTRAAQKVHISQSSISEQVKQLENIIGFEIFSRTGQGTELTDRGRIFLQEAERIYNELLGLSDVAKILQGEGETFAIAIASGLASILVPKLLYQPEIALKEYMHLNRSSATAIIGKLVSMQTA